MIGGPGRGCERANLTKNVLDEKIFLNLKREVLCNVI